MSKPSPTTVCAIETSPGVWRLAFNYKVLGDSRGYTKAQAMSEARDIVRQAQDRARLENRFSGFVLRPS